MKEYPKRGDVYWISLDPAIGTETKKTRPGIVLSNNAQNKASPRIIIAPITSQLSKIYPFEVKILIENKEGKVMLDQLKTIDIQRLGRKICSANPQTIIKIDMALKLVLALD